MHALSSMAGLRQLKGSHGTDRLELPPSSESTHFSTNEPHPLNHSTLNSLKIPSISIKRFIQYLVRQ